MWTCYAEVCTSAYNTRRQRRELSNQFRRLNHGVPSSNKQREAGQVGKTQHICLSNVWQA